MIRRQESRLNLICCQKFEVLDENLCIVGEIWKVLLQSLQCIRSSNCLLGERIPDLEKLGLAGSSKETPCPHIIIQLHAHRITLGDNVCNNNFIQCILLHLSHDPTYSECS